VAGVEAFGVLNPNDFPDEPPQFRAANEDFHYPSICPTKPAGAALGREPINRLYPDKRKDVRSRA
jgi:hypothetical protein